MADGSAVLLPETDGAVLRHCRPPRLRAGTLRRERLLRRLAQTRHVPLTLIVAPAGYGKTTLLAHWLANDARQVAWLTLDEADDEPDRVTESIAVALDIPDLE